MKNTLIRYEWHHKIPRSLGGTDDPDNLIKIPIEEHFIDHLNTAIALRLAWKGDNWKEMRELDPGGTDPKGETHWFAAALIYKRMYGYEIDRVMPYISEHISDRHFRALMSYVDQLDHQKSRKLINDKIERTHTRLVEMPNYGGEGEKTRYRTQKNWNGKRNYYYNA